MIEKILNHFGYIPKEKALEEVALLAGNPRDYPELKKIEEDIFKDLAQVPDIDSFLDITMGYDMQREFSAPDEQRPIVHGAYARTAYLKSGIKKARSLNK